VQPIIITDDRVAAATRQQLATIWSHLLGVGQKLPLAAVHHQHADVAIADPCEPAVLCMLQV
jgi:hypothetical protein